MLRYLYVSVAVALLVGVSVAGHAYAHERRNVTISGKETTWVVGWFAEPTLVDQPNKVSFRVTIPPAAQNASPIPVLGLEKSLRVDVTTGGKSTTLNLSPAFRDPGHYVAEIIPTVSGTYILRFFGSVNGTEIHQVFDCSEGKFDCVEPLSEIQFPEKPPTSREIQNTLSSINAKLAEIDGKISSTNQMSDRAQSVADNVNTIAYGGLGAGILGLAVAAVALARKGKGT